MKFSGTATGFLALVLPKQYSLKSNNKHFLKNCFHFSWSTLDLSTANLSCQYSTKFEGSTANPHKRQRQFNRKSRARQILPEHNLEERMYPANPYLNELLGLQALLKTRITAQLWWKFIGGCYKGAQAHELFNLIQNTGKLFLFLSLNESTTQAGRQPTSQATKTLSTCKIK